MRSIQRQSLSSRSSITSPLAFSENGIKPSWSLSAKLQMRSNSPSRFSLDSRSSPPLERIGEACDDKVSTSCFGSYSRHERPYGGRAPLAMMEGNSSDQDNSKRLLDEVYCRAPTPSDKKNTKGDPTDNNNQITTLDQNTQATPLKEQKRKSSIGGSALKVESTGSKKSSSKAEQEKTSKKRQSVSSTAKSSTAQISSSPQVKGPKVTNSKDKSANVKTINATPTGTPSKKKEPQGPEAGTPQRKQRICSTPQSSASPSPTAKKCYSGTEKNSTSRKKLLERSSSRDSFYTSPLSDKHRGSFAARTLLPKSSEGVRPERRFLRSSSSSSSITSLRSPSVSSRDLRRSSKSEDKGLSFFKSALRQRETRRSADLGKTTILTKKVSERTARLSGQTKNNGADEGEESANASQQASPESHSSEAVTEGRESSKPPTPVRRSLLPIGKSKSSTSETSLTSPMNGKRPLVKMTSSRKLSSSMQSSARPTQKPQ